MGAGERPVDLATGGERGVESRIRMSVWHVWELRDEGLGGSVAARGGGREAASCGDLVRVCSAVPASGMLELDF